MNWFRFTKLGGKLEIEYGNGKTITLPFLENPVWDSAVSFTRGTEWGVSRGVLFGGNIFVWDGSELTHSDFVDELRGNGYVGNYGQRFVLKVNGNDIIFGVSLSFGNNGKEYRLDQVRGELDTALLRFLPKGVRIVDSEEINV